MSKPPRRPPNRGGHGPRRWPLVGLLLVVVAVVLVAAIIVTALTKKDSTSAADVQQTRPATITGTALAELPDSGDDPAVGLAAPVVKGEDFAGAVQTIGGASAKPTLLMFVAHWCPHCQREVPRLVGWRADGTIPADIDLVVVSTAVTPSQDNYPPSTWLDQVGWADRIMADTDQSSAAEAYGLSAFPFFVALDQDGKVLARGTGELDQASIKELVQKLEAGAS